MFELAGRGVTLFVTTHYMGEAERCTDIAYLHESRLMVLRRPEELKALAARQGRSLPQLALRWAISNPAVSTALVGCRTVAEVEDNVGALGFSIAEGDLAEIDAIFTRNGVNPVPERWVEES